MYTKLTKKFLLLLLPNDNKLRVVWAYGAILRYTNKSYIPNIEIGVRFTLNFAYFFKIL